MTYKTKKKKETTPAGNGTQRTSYTPLGIPFLVPPRSANAQFQNSEEATVGNQNSEGAKSNGRLRLTAVA